VILDVLGWLLVAVLVALVLFVGSAAVAGVLRAVRQPSRAEAWDQGWEASEAHRAMPAVYGKDNPYREEKTDG
jgi:hypothetical protein